VRVFLALFAADIATPLLAGWDARLGGHRGHIVERYGLFTLIVLGESIAAATVAIAGAIDSAAAAIPLLTLAAGGLVVAFSLWWIYFEFTTGHAPEHGTAAQFIWGYGHYFVFAAVAAIGAGLALSVQWISDPAHVALADWGAALVIGVPVAVFLVTVALIEWVAERNDQRVHLLTKVGAALLSVGAAFAAPTVTVPGSVLLIGLVLACLVGYGVALQHRLYAGARVSD
jgi:low temperature requirement protein LtrA